MKVLILSNHFNPGGISRYVLTLAKEIKKKGNKVWVGSRGGDWVKFLVKEEIPHKKLPLNTKFFLSPKIFLTFLFLYPFLKKEKIDIIHANTRITQVLAFLLSLFLKVPYISTFHGFYRPHFFRRFLSLEGERAIAISNSVKEHLKRDLKIKESKIAVIYNGIELKKNNITRKKEDYGFSQKNVILGMVSRLSSEKGHLLALSSYKLLLKEYPHIFLLIGGEGKMQGEIEKFIKDEGLNERVRIFLKNPQHLFDIMDILLIPSRKEGFGLTILEAMLRGIVVVGYNVGGIGEIIKHKKNGILFDNYTPSCLARAIKLVLEDEKLRQNIIATAREDVQHYSAEKMAQTTMLVYEEVIKSIL